MLAPPLGAQTQTTSFSASYIDDAFVNGLPVSNPLLDHLGAPLTAGGSGAGDGAILQYGYFTSTADPSAFGASDWDTFVPITSAPETRLITTIGDPGGGLGLEGIFSIPTSFTGTEDSSYLPVGGVFRSGIRFFNGTSLEGSTHYNLVTSSQSNWIFPGLSALPPVPSSPMSLDNDSLVWQGSAFATSLPVASSGTVVWQDSGSDWTSSARWDNSGGGSAPPGSSDIASFPNDSTITNQPDLAGSNQSLSGLLIDNTGEDYTFRDSIGTGSLTIGADGIAVSGGGTATFGVDGAGLRVVLGESQTWDIATGSTLLWGEADNTLDLASNTLTVAGGGTLTLNAGSVANFDAAVDVDLTVGTLHLTGDPGTTDFNARVGDATIVIQGTTLAIERAAGTTSTVEVNGTLDGTVTGAGDAVLRKVGTGTATVNSMISGAGGITIDDSDAGDTIRLTANNAYTGATAVASGVLLIDGDQSGATGAVTVSGLGQLGGTGTVGGATNMDLGSELAAGTDGTTGTLRFANGLDSSDATWLVDIVSASDLDVVDVTGNLDLTGAQLTVSGSLSDGQPHVIATYSGTLTGTFAFDNLPAGWSIDYSFGLADNQIALVPEPGTIVPLAAILAPWIMRRRRQ